MGNHTINDDLLSELNYQKFVLRMPVVVYVSVLMTLGLFGNILVCVYYGCKTRTSTGSFFIVSLAVFDLIVCSITMPNEIIDLRFAYVFTNVPACKIPRCVNHVAANGSATTLLVIAIDRYKRMCKPLSPQLGAKHARIAIFIAIVFSLLLSWPAAIFYKPVSVPIHDSYNKSVVLNGSFCTTTREDQYKPYLWAFNSLQFVIFVVAVIVLFVLYSLIGRSICRYKERRLKYASTRRASRYSESSYSIKNGSTEISIKTIESASDQTITATHTNNANEIKDRNTSESNDRKLSRRSFSGSCKSLPESTDKDSVRDKTPDINTVKFSIQMLVIAIIYVVGYLPYLVLVIWRIFQTSFEGEILNDTQYLWFNIGVRSYLLNSAINPMVYGFFNEHFRRFFFATFFPCCRKK